MENRKFNTRAIVEAGLLSAIIVVLMMMTLYAPILGGIIVFMLPIPTTILYMRHGVGVAVTGVIASTLLTVVLFDPLTTIVLGILFGVVGLLLGYCFSNNKSPLFTIIIIAIALLVGICVNILITALFVYKTDFMGFFNMFFNMINQGLSQAVADIKQTYESMGAPEEVIKQVDQIAKNITLNATLSIVVLLLTEAAFISALLDYTITKSILVKMGYNIRKMKPFTELYVTSLAGAFIVMPMAAGMFMYGNKIPGGEIVLIVGRILMQVVFLAIGISVVCYFLKNRFKLSTGVRVLIGLLAVINAAFGTICIYIGLADMILDFRKINPSRALKR